MIEIYLFSYLIFINLIAVVVTICDKSAAISKQPRVSEFALLFLGFIGGSLSMFITMLLIRHKTRKPKFMFLLPLFILIQSVTVYFLLERL